MASRSVTQTRPNGRNAFSLFEQLADRPEPESPIKVRTTVTLTLSITKLQIPAGTVGEVLDFLFVRNSVGYWMVNFPGLVPVVKFPDTTSQIEFVR